MMSLRALGRLRGIPDNRIVRNNRLGRKQGLAIFCLLLAVVIESACGGLGTKSDGVQPPGLTFNPTSLDFGGIAVNNSKTNSITVTNTTGTGGANISVSQIAVSGAGFSATSNPLPPFTLAPGQSASVSVTFAPKTSGTVNGVLTITLSDSSQGTVDLSGNGLAPGQLSVSPTTMNFGSVSVGSSK